MSDALGALLSQHAGIEIDTWRSFWDRLEAGRVDRTEAAAVLSSLATRFPDHGTVRNLLTSFDERRPPVPRRWPGSVNIVGTGGGPKTFNVSTAAALVAAAMGVPVVKTGSRAYTSSVGSIDLLERLGIRLTTSYADTEDTLAKFGVAFAGQFVYPGMLGRLARTIVPMGMRPFGRFLNALGPFLAGLPVTAQVTGVSETAPLADLELLAGAVTDRTIWLCTNDLGADELFGFTENAIHTNGGALFRLHPGELTAGTGSLFDVESVATEHVVDHFLDVVSGVAGDAATETVCLNAAALAVASGQVADWTRAVSAAYEVVRGGAARLLVDRLRLSGGKPAAVVRAVANG